jgi:hypothetical protein
MAQYNRDKALKMPTPQGEAKGLDTIGQKRKAQSKFKQHKELTKHECKLPLNKCVQTQVLP